MTPGDRCQPVYVRGVEAAPAGQVGRHACASKCMCATGGSVRFVVLGFEQPYEARRLHLSGCADMRVNVFAYVGICARTCLLPFAHARQAEPPRERSENLLQGSASAPNPKLPSQNQSVTDGEGEPLLWQPSK